MFQTPHSTLTNTYAPKGINPFIATWLEKIGYSLDDYFSLTSWDLKTLPDFKQLIAMDKAVERIITALEQKQSIAVFGDYDVDGTTSCALFYRFFKKLGHTIKVYQPSRFIEGYGLHPVSVELAHQEGVQLLITVDCGTTSHAAAERALELGIDLIITDHHKDAAPSQPSCLALINPNRRDEPQGPMQALAGVGVAFAVSLCVREKLIAQGQMIESLYDLLPYVAIGTISDLATLNPMNLILCRHGFKALMQSKDLGLKKFLEKKELSLEYLDSELISFFIGPMINSKGRLDHPEVALELLTAVEPTHINQHFELLMQTNHQRKKIQNDVFEEAKNDMQQELLTHPQLSALIAYRPQWHEGVIGIVASKLVEEFQRPALVFTNSDKEGFIKASIRTANGIDIFEALKTHEHFFTKFGGHKAAAGLTLPLNVFADFKNSFLLHMQKQQLQMKDFDQQTSPILNIDFLDIDGQLLQDIYKLAPFGQGHPMPKWRILGAKIKHYDILKDHHVKWNFVPEKQNSATQKNFQKSLNGMSFNFLKKNNFNLLSEMANSHQPLILDAWIKINIFKGNQYLQLIVDQLSH